MTGRAESGIGLAMNKYDPGGPEAKLHYGNNEITILREGLFVRCAVTGQRIPLDDLRYWNVDRQEAYCGPEAALARWNELRSRT
jgi:hypothetical protein